MEFSGDCILYSDLNVLLKKINIIRVNMGFPLQARVENAVHGLDWFGLVSLFKAISILVG